MRPRDIVDFVPDPALYPFRSNWFESSVGPVHYLDEGVGRPILLLHGNPDWSFLFRNVIPELYRFRCIAVDYPGFGLSTHPDGYGYTPGEHAAVVAELVEHLDLVDLVVFGQDWGGPIGLDVASRSPERVTGLVMGNTFFWPATEWTPRLFSAVLGTSLMQRLILDKNLLVERLLPRLLQVELSDEEHDHYRAVAPTSAHRKGFAAFPRMITASEEWLRALEARVRETLADVPMALVFGRKDPGLASPKAVARWAEVWPDARVLDLPEAGHFFQEDAPQELAAHIVAVHGRMGSTRSALQATRAGR